MKSLTKLSLNLHILMWVSIFPVFWRAEIADLSLVGAILFVAWFGVVWSYRNRQLPRDKNEYVGEEDNDLHYYSGNQYGELDPSRRGALSGGANPTTRKDDRRHRDGF